LVRLFSKDGKAFGFFFLKGVSRRKTALRQGQNPAIIKQKSKSFSLSAKEPGAARFYKGAIP